MTSAVRLMRLAKAEWMCPSCGWRGKFKSEHPARRRQGICVRPGDRPKIGDCNTRPVYFQSQIELRVAADLVLLQKAEKISNLSFHPRFQLKVGTRKVATYVADMSYIEDGKWIIVDVKPKGGYKTELAKLKIKLFEACYASKDYKVTIVER